MVLRFLLLALVIVPAHASEADALAISANIQAKHMPFGTILDPIYASSSSNQIIGYTRCGDSALWTGAYLAAEAFRYKVTQSPDALINAQKAIAGLKSLADVTFDNLLARCIVDASSPYAQGIASEESANGIHQAAPWFWVGNTSRDEYVGAIFGLGAAYDLIDDAPTQASISALVTRLVGFLTGQFWSIVMPDGSITTTFLIRPDELLTLLEVANHVNPSKFSSAYSDEKFLLGDSVPLPIGVDITSDDSYFKFNLASMCFYNLLRLDGNGSYKTAYSLLRGHTAPQQNAFFDIVDRPLSGPNKARDQETRSLLEQWLQRTRRDPFSDATKLVADCGSQACQPIPLLVRPPAQYLWQVSPYQLSGGGSGIIEGAGIDYILPYWMARYYGVITPSAVSSSAATTSAVAPSSFATLFGSNLSTITAQPQSLPLPVTLGGVTLTVTDAAGVARPAGLVYISPSQVNFVVPDGTSTGTATFTVNNGAVSQTFTGLVQSVVPTLFSMSSTGTGVAAATAIQVQASNAQLQGPVAVFQCSAGVCTSVPIALGVDTPIYVTFYGTGIRGLSALTNVHLTIDGTSIPVQFAGPQPSYPGLDQVNVPLPLSLRGDGESNVVLTVDGQVSNTVTISVK
jgi:uncharacterized protein (TIGR03437 family)